jgi:hypothetical protein
MVWPWTVVDYYWGHTVKNSPKGKELKLTDYYKGRISLIKNYIQEIVKTTVK